LDAQALNVSTHAFASPTYSRLDPETTGRLSRSIAKPTKVQSAIEMTLFSVFGVSILLCAIAFYSIYSPAHQAVPNRVAAGAAAGRINVLVVGSTQETNSVKTQSLTIVSVQPKTGQTALIALPRDLWVKIKNHGSHRLGAALNIGESGGYPGEGPGLVSDTVEKVIGQPVHAYVRVETDDLRTTIDALGGIEVQVPHSFNEGRGRDRFIAGRTRLDGKRAIRYAQSLQVSGPQGTRGARETRQQQVVAAVIQKLAQSPEARQKLALAKLTGEDSSTNLTSQQVDQLCGSIASAPAIRYVTLEPLVAEFEVASVFEAGEAVRPRHGNFEQVHALARNIFSGAQPVAALH
jgi:LCP family protein required for cell wall assembly